MGAALLRALKALADKEKLFKQTQKVQISKELG
jgi:hypothetical protein